MTSLRAIFGRHRYLLVGGIVTVLALGRILWMVTAVEARYVEIDFAAYFGAAERLLHGGSVFLPFQLAGPYPAHSFDAPYLYPPPFAALLVPLAATGLSSLAAGLLFSAVTFLAAAATLVALAREAGLVRGARAGLILAGLLWIWPPVGDVFVTGNVELLLVALLAAGELALRRDRQVLGGALFGLAILVKIQPILLLPYLLATGRGRAALAALTTMALVSLAALPLTGPGDWLALPRALANLVPDGSTPIPSLGAALGLLVPGLAGRLLGLAAAAGLVWWAARRSRLAGFGLAILLGFLLSPLVWLRYLSLLAPVLVLLAARGERRLALAAWLLAFGSSSLLGGAAGEILLATMLSGSVVLVGLGLLHLREPGPNL